MSTSDLVYFKNAGTGGESIYGGKFAGTGVMYLYLG
jgi:hypothetical protein